MSTRKKNPAPRKAPAAPKVSQPEKIGLDEIKGLIALVARESFAEFEFEAGGMRFSIRKEGAVTLMTPPAFGSPVAHLPAQSVAAPVPVTQAAPAAAAPIAPLDDPSIHYLTSPIVGTFYQASNPNAPAFVKVGDRVKPGQTLCIVEAMKLMNEIECDVAGEVVQILSENGQPVEYGERLFAIRVS